MPRRFSELRLRGFLKGAGAVLTPRLFAAAVIMAGFGAMLAVNWPGHLEFDSIRQLLEGRRGIYSNWHPPIMSWMLGVFDAAIPGGALFVLFDALLAFGALLSLLWLVPRPSWWAVAAALVIAALPQLFLFQAIVWKDILFADACLAGFVCLGHGLQHWNSPPWRSAFFGASVLFITLAILSRQNGFLVLPCAALALGAGVVRITTRQRGFVHGAGFLLCCALLAFTANAALQLRAAKAFGPTEQIEDLQLYDIGGMLKRQPDLPLSVLEKEKPLLANALREKAPYLFTPVWQDRLTGDPAIHRWIPSSVSAVSRQWRVLIAAHPGTYLAVRMKDFGWLFLSQHLHECLTFVVGVISVPADLKAAKLPFRYDDRDAWLNDSYATPLMDTPAFSHPFFAAIGLVSLILLLRRRRPADFAMAGLLLAAFLYTLSYFLVSIACQYRYLYALDLSAIACAFYLLAELRPVEWWRSQHRTSRETC
jgi:4-amino-4-deoxy-L-arabinose transferase-like glycosyltransferase